MRTVLALLMTVHGLIHLLGFLKAFQLAEVPQLSGATTFALPAGAARVVGAGWLVACLVFVAAAVMLLFRSGPWWMVGAVGLVLSQALIVHAWPDAKAGTVLNVVLLLPVVVAWADAAFQGVTDAQVRALFDRVPEARTAVVDDAALSPLPAPVQGWLRASGVVGRPIPRVVRLRQRGHMRTAPDGPELPATAQQYFGVDRPEFIWRVRVRMLRLLPIAGRDTYLDGRGRMVIKLASLATLVDAADAKIDQGALLRFLAETVWFPAAALQPYIAWEPLDDRSARATMTHQGVSASAVFTFDERGRFVRLSARRYFGGGDDAKLERWEVEAQGWRVMDGCQVPVRGEVRWKLADATFTFYRWELTALEYDPPGPFEAAP